MGDTAFVDGLVTQAPVVVFTDVGGHSRRATAALRLAGISFHAIHVEHHEQRTELRRELLQKTGKATLPAVFVNKEVYGDANTVCKALHNNTFPIKGDPQKAAAGASDVSAVGVAAAAAVQTASDPAQPPTTAASSLVKKVEPPPSLDEFMQLSEEERDQLGPRISKSALKKLLKGERVRRRKQEAASRQAIEEAAIAHGRAQRAEAGLAQGGPAEAARSAIIAAAHAEAKQALAKVETEYAEPARVELWKSESGPLMGQDKWLGGMCSPCGRFVYGVPGTAKRVLSIEVASGKVEEIGPSFAGAFKWLRGVDVPPSVMGAEKFPSGACYALPSNASSVLKIDPATQEVTTVGGPFEGDWLWHGGALASDGCIYAIPCNAQHVLKIDVRTDEVTFIGGPWPQRQKWYGGILGANGCIYGIPQSAGHVLKIDPKTQECTLLDPALPEGKWLWHGGTFTPDRTRLYCFPNHADHVLKIDTTTDEVTLIGGPEVIKSGRHRVPQDGRYKYLGGAYCPGNNSVYCFPCDAERVLKIDCDTDEVSVVGRELLQAPGTSWNGMNKWQNGFFSPRDGCVYAVPQRADGVLRVVPATKENGLTSDYVEVMDCGDECRAFKEKFEGGVMSHQGDIFCIPLRAKHVLKVVPATPVDFEPIPAATLTTSWGGNE